MLYAAQFSPDGQRIAAGGSGRDEVRIYEARSRKVLGVAALAGAAYCLDWASSCETVCHSSCPLGRHCHLPAFAFSCYPCRCSGNNCEAPLRL